MKNTIKLTVVGLIGLAIVASAPLAQAGGYLTSMQTTNYIVGSATGGSITQYPTNNIGTNGLGQGTGKAVGIGNVREFGFNFQGFLVNTGAAKVCSVLLMPSMATGQPVISYGTNTLVAGTVLNDSDFADPTACTQLIFPLPATYTNWYNWQTNFSVNWSPLPSANWVGIYQITNNLTAGCYVTNALLPGTPATSGSLFFINTKLYPTPLIGQ